MKTLATVFKEVYGEALKEYGFKKVKGKYPYYARVVGDEIVHVITYKEEWCPGYNMKAFSIIGGVATVYRGKINFEKKPKDNTDWLLENLTIYSQLHHYDADAEYTKKIFDFRYNTENETSLIKAMENSLNETKRNLLLELNKVVSLEKCVEYFYIFNSPILRIYLDHNFGKRWNGYDRNEGLLNTIVYGETDFERYVNDKRKNQERFEKLEEYWMEIGKSGLTKEEHEKLKLDRENGMLEQIQLFKTAVSDTEWKEKIKMELEQRKKNNLEILKKFGLM